jgi:plasmid stabilization system protein ParE
VKLRFTARAARDLAEIADYLRARNPAGAGAVRDAILRSLRNLALSRSVVEGVRKLVTPKYRYLIYFTIGERADEIVLLAIQHPARRREYQDV